MGLQITHTISHYLDSGQFVPCMPEHCGLFIEQFCFILICDLSEGPALVPEGYCLGNNTDVHIPTSNVKGEGACSRGCLDSKEIIKSHWPAETKLCSKRKTNNRQEATGNQAWLRKAALGGIAQFPLTNSHHGPNFFLLGSDRHEFKFQFVHTASVHGSVSFGFNSRFSQSSITPRPFQGNGKSATGRGWSRDFTSLPPSPPALKPLEISAAPSKATIPIKSR